MIDKPPFTVIGDEIYFDGYLVALLTEAHYSANINVINYLRQAVTIENVKDAEGELKDKREAFEVEKTSVREHLNGERDAFHKHIKEHDLHVLQGFIDKVKGLAKGGLLRVKDVEAFAEKHVDDLSVEQDNVPDPPLTCEEKEAEAAQ